MRKNRPHHLDLPLASSVWCLQEWAKVQALMLLRGVIVRSLKRAMKTRRRKLKRKRRNSLKPRGRKMIASGKKLRQREKSLNARKRRMLTRKSSLKKTKSADFRMTRKEVRLLALRAINLVMMMKILLQRVCKRESQLEALLKSLLKLEEQQLDHLSLNQPSKDLCLSPRTRMLN